MSRATEESPRRRVAPGTSTRTEPKDEAYIGVGGVAGVNEGSVDIAHRKQARVASALQGCNIGFGDNRAVIKGEVESVDCDGFAGVLRVSDPNLEGAPK